MLFLAEAYLEAFFSIHIFVNRLIKTLTVVIHLTTNENDIKILYINKHFFVLRFKIIGIQNYK